MQLARQDSQGRVRYTKERREELLGEFDRSGMSGASFARLSGVRYTTFAGWIKSRKRKAEREGMTAGTEERSGPIRLLEAMVDAADHRPNAGVDGLRIELPGGSGLTIESPVQMQMAAELVALIAERRSRGC
jgi:hypothetical protein